MITAALRILCRAGMDYDTARDTCADVAALLTRRLPSERGQLWAAQLEAQLAVRRSRDHERQIYRVED